MSIKITVFWHMTLCVIDTQQGYRGTCFCQFQLSRWML